MNLFCWKCGSQLAHEEGRAAPILRCGNRNCASLFYLFLLDGCRVLAILNE